jgi:hypothetical protein
MTVARGALTYGGFWKAELAAVPIREVRLANRKRWRSTRSDSLASAMPL